jgi:hypothetical protein
MQTKAATVEAYLHSLPEGRRAIISAVRSVILANLDPAYEEGIQYGVIGYYVPHRVYPKGYPPEPKQPAPFAALASQKNYMSLYLMSDYCGCLDDSGDNPNARWFREAWAKTGKKLDMGKACIRFKRLEDLPLDLIGEAIRRIPASRSIEICEASRGAVADRATRKPPEAVSKASVARAPKKKPR